MTFMERIYLPAILKGMGTTLKHFFKVIFNKSNTLRYPEVKREFAKVYRGWHVLKRDEQGREELYRLWFMCSGLSGRGDHDGSRRARKGPRALVQGRKVRRRL